MGRGDPMAGPAALGAGGCLLRVGAGLRVGVDVLLEEPGGQITPQFAGAFLTLVEGDELILVFRAEHEVEGGGGMAEPALAEFFTLGIGAGLSIVHDGDSRQSRAMASRCLAILSRRHARRNATAPPRLRPPQVLSSSRREGTAEEVGRGRPGAGRIDGGGRRLSAAPRDHESAVR